MTPPNSVLISGYIHRALAYEAKGDYAHARDDYKATLAIVASDAGSKANQATAKVRLSLVTDALTPIPRDAPSPVTQPAPQQRARHLRPRLPRRRLASASHW